MIDGGAESLIAREPGIVLQTWGSNSTELYGPYHLFFHLCLGQVFHHHHPCTLQVSAAPFCSCSSASGALTDMKATGCDTSAVVLLN